MSLRIQVLGPVRAWRDGAEIALGPTGRRAVLGLLAVAGGQPVPRAELVDALWRERPPASATNVIQTHLKHLRRLLDPGRQRHAPSTVLPAVGDGYALRLRADQLDLSRFRQLATSADRVHQDGDQRRAAGMYGQALALWHGTPLADVPGLAAHPKVVALAGERRLALLGYVDAMIAAGTADAALTLLAETAAAEPLDEAVQARLIRAYQAAGKRAAAFATYRATRERLAEELGVRPGRELAAAHATLLQDGPAPEPAGTPVAAPPPAEASPRRAVPAQLPADVPGFTGRTGELAALTEFAELAGGTGAAEPTAVPVVAVCGTAGVGKTALVTHWAHRVRAEFPDGQLHVDLRGHDPEAPVPAGEALARFLTALGVNGQDIPLDLEDRAARYRTALAGRRALVVLDNARSVEQLRPLLPGTPSCVVVVTSRDSLAGLVALHGARRLDLDQLPLPDAVALLRRLIGARVDEDAAAAATLADRCARLPLALRVAAELATSRPGTPLAELAGELADQGGRLELLEAGGYPRAAVRTVLSWSYRHLPADAARAFRLLGLAPFPELTPHAVAALHGTDLDHARRLVRTLALAHLVQPRPGDRFGTHDLLHAYATELATGEEAADDRTAARVRLFDQHLATAVAATDLLYPAARRQRAADAGAGPAATPTVPPPVTDAASARAWLDAELPQLAGACAYAAGQGWPRYAIGLAEALYRYLEAGHHTEALAVHSHALAAATGIGDRSGQARALTNLGVVYRLLGQYEPAEEHFQRSLALHHERGDRAGEARTLSNLGIVDDRRGRYAEALERYGRALDLYRQVDDPYGEASTLNNMAAVHRTLGEHGTATDEYRRAFTLFQRAGDRAGEAIALSNLGVVEERQGRYERAADHQRQALALFRDLDHRYGEAAALNSLGDAIARLGRYGEAAEHQRQALELFRELGHRYGEATALNGLGEARRGDGDPAGAAGAHRAALAIAVETGDRDEQARAHTGLARASEAAGDPDAARQHWRRALDLHTELGSPEVEEIRTRLAAER